MVKNLHASAGGIRDAGLVPGSGRSPGGGHGHPLQCSGLQNPMDRGAWWAMVHRVTKRWARGLYLSSRLLQDIFTASKLAVVSKVAIHIWVQVFMWTPVNPSHWSFSVLPSPDLPWPPRPRSVRSGVLQSPLELTLWFTSSPACVPCWGSLEIFALAS